MTFKTNNIHVVNYCQVNYNAVLSYQGTAAVKTVRLNVIYVLQIYFHVIHIFTFSFYYVHCFSGTMGVKVV